MKTSEAVVIRLKQVIAENDFNISQAAISAGIPRRTLYSIFYGESKSPKIVTIKMICDGIGISLTEFFNSPIFENLEQEIE